MIVGVECMPLKPLEAISTGDGLCTIYGSVEFEKWEQAKKEELSA